MAKFFGTKSIVAGFIVGVVRAQDLGYIVDGVQFGKTYHIHKLKHTDWNAANAACQELGFELVTFADEAEWNYVNSLVVSEDAFWTGYRDDEGVVVSTSSKPGLYTAFKENEPNNNLEGPNGETEDCIRMRYGSMNDALCAIYWAGPKKKNIGMGYICQTTVAAQENETVEGPEVESIDEPQVQDGSEAAASEDGISVSCMDGDLVKMTATVPVDDVQIDLTTEGWTLVDQSYTKSWTANDFSESEISAVGDDLVLKKTIESSCERKQVGDATVCISTGHSLDFECKYAMGTKTVTADLGVSGHDANVNAENTGELKYTMSIDKTEVEIGKPVTVTITPANTNLVFAKIQECSVKHNEMSVPILQTIEETLHPVCVVGTTVNTGKGKQLLSFQWNAFKWETAGNVDETHTVTCTIALSKDDPAFTVDSCPVATPPAAAPQQPASSY